MQWHLESCVVCPMLHPANNSPSKFSDPNMVVLNSCSLHCQVPEFATWSNVNVQVKENPLGVEKLVN